MGHTLALGGRAVA